MKQVMLTYYDGTGKHVIRPCDFIEVIAINYTIPAVKEPSFIFRLHRETEDNPKAEDVIVPFTHSIKAV